MKKVVKVAAGILMSAAATSPAFSASAEEAVNQMGQAAKKVAMQKENVSKRTTGSLETKGGFDARGVVIANAEVTLAAGVANRIERMPLKAGEAFSKGEALVVFDCARQLADLRGAKAALGKASSFYQGKKRLKARGAAGGQEVREAAADVASASASVDALQQVISLCRIDAPFNGRVVERHAETYEIPAINGPLMTVVDSSTLELDLIVPSTWLRWVQKGTKFQFAVDELGRSFDARVVRTGAKVDPVSQTIKITGAFENRPNRVLAGMSGTAKFVPPTN